jgi:hypothetical protein
VLCLLLVGLGGARCAAAQCTGEGTVLVPGQWEVGPPLPCEVGGSQIAWLLYTPPHHESVPALGSTFAGVRTLPQLFVRYRCTGFWLWPTQIAEVKTLGYVFDVRVRPCDGGASVGAAALLRSPPARRAEQREIRETTSRELAPNPAEADRWRASRSKWRLSPLEPAATQRVPPTRVGTANERRET